MFRQQEKVPWREKQACPRGYTILERVHVGSTSTELNFREERKNCKHPCWRGSPLDALAKLDDRAFHSDSLQPSAFNHSKRALPDRARAPVTLIAPSPPAFDMPLMLKEPRWNHIADTKHDANNKMRESKQLAVSFSCWLELHPSVRKTVEREFECKQQANRDHTNGERMGWGLSDN